MVTQLVGPMPDAHIAIARAFHKLATRDAPRSYQQIADVLGISKSAYQSALSVGISARQMDKWLARWRVVHGSVELTVTLKGVPGRASAQAISTESSED